MYSYPPAFMKAMSRGDGGSGDNMIAYSLFITFSCICAVKPNRS